MICDLCKSENNSLDDRLGERVCDDCGYVMVANLYEETVSPIVASSMEAIRTGDKGHLGSNIGNEGNTRLIRSLRKNQRRLRDRATQNMAKGILECNMILSPWLPNSNLKERVHAYYKRFFQDRHTWRWTVGARATALVFIVLKENGMAVTLSELSESNNENKRHVSKAARYFAREIGKPWLLNQMGIDNWVEKCGNTLVYLNGENFKQEEKREFISDSRIVSEYISYQLEGRDIQFTKLHLACCFWITCLLRTRGTWPEYTQAEICKSCGASTNATGMRHKMRQMYNMLNINKKGIKRLSVAQFVAGVRYE
tara:strand:- start:238 stop:1173 length:936 start_codon:yes stop_codon:yes gene_type:complete